MGAALALARALAAGSIPGGVRYYGCPAEEVITGKALMARAAGPPAEGCGDAAPCLCRMAPLNRKSSPAGIA